MTRTQISRKMTLELNNAPPKPTPLKLQIGESLRASSCTTSGRQKQASMLSGRVLCWFSCGVASAVAAKLAAALYANKATVELIYCNTAKDEHPDNARFRADVERWVGLPVKIIGSKLYETTDDVFRATKYMSGISGARCTTELKKIPRFEYQWAEDTHIFGMTVDESKRIQSFEEANHELDCEWPLRDAGWTKQDCHEYVKSAGIEIPAMYRLGFKNNNCIGCVKATSPAYWNLTRKNFPDRYRQRAEQSRELGVRLVRYKGVRIFLDELPEDATEKITEDLSCGPQCTAYRIENDQSNPQPDERK